MSQSPVSRRRRALIARQGAEEQPSTTERTMPSSAAGTAEDSAGAAAPVKVAETWWTGSPLESHPQSLMEQLRKGEVEPDLQQELVQFFVHQPCACGSTPEESNMSVSRFDQLLEQLPRFARVINAFESPEIQKEVFDALMKVYVQERESSAVPPREAEAAVSESEPLAELAGGGSAIDDDDDMEHETGTGLQLDLSADSTARSGSRGTSTAGGDSIHSFIQG